MKYHKAPSSRIYESEQPLRQMRFPEKRRFVKFSTEPKPQNRKRRAFLESQQTVTQMGWVVPVEDVDRNDEMMIENDEDTEKEEDEGQQQVQISRRNSAGSKKRRRTGWEKTESQDTLTQMHWFVNDSEEDEEDALSDDESLNGEQPEENEENHRIPPSGQGYSSSPNQPLPPIMSLQPVKQESQLTPAPSPSPSPVKFPTPSKLHNGNTAPSPDRKPPDSVFKIPITPQKREMRREIPSSQSPATTPLSMYSNINSQSKSRRTPLSEIPRNELAVRDLSTSPSPTKRKTPLAAAKGGVRKRLPRRRKKTMVQDSNDDNADETTASEQHSSPSSSSDNDDDEENQDPESNIPKPPAFGKKQIRKRNQHAASSPGAMDSSTQAPSLTASAFRSAYAPAPPSSASIGPSAGLLADTQLTHTLVRSSQASTVDESQQQQGSFPAVPSSRQGTPPASSFRTACTSSMPELPMSTATSVLQRSRWRECSPVASINNSLDIVTVSQLIPKDLGMNSGFGDD